VKYSTRDGWILRPQDIPDAFDPSEDTWYYPRVNGTFKERKGWHGCQMPEQVLGRIIRACSRPGELVLDPFTGSGTTLAVAKKLGREFLGFELSEQYAARANERLSGVSAGDPLDGVVNPIDSVPSTDKGIRLDDRTARLSGKIH
jgi:site-specific DNA-methyltransferase (adenine-specific)